LANQAANEALASDQLANGCVFQLVTRWSNQDRPLAAACQLTAGTAPSSPATRTAREVESGATDQRQGATGSMERSHRHASYSRRTPDSHSHAFDVTAAGNVHISAVGLAVAASPAQVQAHDRCTSPGRHQQSVDDDDDEDDVRLWLGWWW